MLTSQYNFLTNFYLRIYFLKYKLWHCTILKNLQDKFFIFSTYSIFRNRFNKTAEFQDILPRLTLEREANRWKIAKNGYLCDSLLPWQKSAIYFYERKWNPRCVANLHCECPELKPRVETSTSFLVIYPCSGVGTVKTVGSHLKWAETQSLGYPGWLQ